MARHRTFIRQSDKKTFNEVEDGHWVTVRATDGEEDTIKWYGGEGSCEYYASAEKGFSYNWHSKKSPRSVAWQAVYMVDVPVLEAMSFEECKEACLEYRERCARVAAEHGWDLDDLDGYTLE